MTGASSGIGEATARRFAKHGWQVVAVPGLVPDDIFFDHLANRRFGLDHPSGRSDVAVII